MDLSGLIDSWQGKRVVVIGDAIEDLYVFGSVERVCPEAPVPVLIKQGISQRAGGAANVREQLHALGLETEAFFAATPSRKTRYMTGSHLLLRVDNDVYSEPQDADIEAAVAAIERAHAVVISDYGKGWASFEMCSAAIWRARKRNIPVIVDPKEPDWTKFSGANVVCPNLKEWQFAKNVDTNSAVVVKCGAAGLRLYPRIHETAFVIQKHFPAQARRVYDVTGAGDTVTAVVAATLAQCDDLEEACTLANVAAGWVVGEIGTTVISKEKLKELVCQTV